MNKLTPALALVLVAALASACNSTQTPAEPGSLISQEASALSAPEAWAFGPEVDGEVADTWAGIIRDEALLALMEQALAANPGLRASAESVRRSEAFLRQSRSGLLPGIGASAGASGSSDFEDFDLTERYTASLDASWEADLWGAIRSDILASQYDLESARAVYRASRESLTAGVARAYAVAIDARHQVALTRATLAAQEETLRIVDVRYKLGAADRREQLEAVVALVQAGAPGIGLTVDPVENRGFEYHTGVSFSLFAARARGELGRGGRYRAGVAREKAVGASLFIDAVADVLPPLAEPRRLFLAAADRPLAARFQAEGWVTVAALEDGVDLEAEARRLRCSHYTAGGAVKAVAPGSDRG